MQELICEKCMLFDKKNNLCGVKVIVDGEYQQLQVKPKDPCIWHKIDNEIEKQLEIDIENCECKEIKMKMQKELGTFLEIREAGLMLDENKKLKAKY